MARFSTLDHFILSQGLFDNSVVFVCTVHNVNNLSNNESLFLVLWLSVDLSTMFNRMPTDKIAWHKANEDQLAAYHEALAANLADVAVPFDAILCRNLCYPSCSHHSSITEYSERISDACLGTSDSAFLTHVIVVLEEVYQVGLKVSNHVGRNRFFGMAYD